MASSKKAAARKAALADDSAFPPPTAAEIDELDRIVAEMDDPTRYLVVSAFSRRFCLYYDAESNCYTHNRPGDATHFKCIDVARAVLKSLQGRRKRRHSNLQIIRAKKTKTGLRLLEKPRDWLGDLVRARRNSGNRKSEIRNRKS
jgi:hypothetical protein